MRILANYGFKTNGDSYSVTFETIGDVEKEHAPTTVDELFRLAKQAVQRQLSGPTGEETPQQQPTDVTVAQPKTKAVSVNNNSNGNRDSNGNGEPNGKEKRPTIKDPTRSATPKQITLVKRLSREKSVRLPNFTDLTMGEASAMIDQLRDR